MNDRPPSQLLTKQPLLLTPVKNVAAGYSSVVGQYDADRALERDGSIIISFDKRNSSFEISLTNGKFSDPKRPLRSPKTSVIELSQEELHAIVQQTRDSWTKEVVNYFRIHKAKNGIETRRYAFQEAFRPSIDSAKFCAIAASLAVAGSRLFVLLFERSSDRSLKEVAARLKQIVRTGECAFTVDSQDFHIPWGMLYTHPSPNDALLPDGSNFEPSGFWGYQHIIEQFTNKHQVTDKLTAADGKLKFGAAIHEHIDKRFKVKCVAQHKHFIDANKKRLRYVKWTTKAEVGKALAASPFDHRILYFLCHAQGAGTGDHPNLLPPTIELTDAVPIDASDLKVWLEKDFVDNQPLVFLNACQAGHVTTLLYRQFTFAAEFLAKGAACVVGPQIEIPAVFAGEYGRRFFNELLQPGQTSPQVGRTIRKLNQQFWKENNPLGLVYSLYAGADCHVQWLDGESIS